MTKNTINRRALLTGFGATVSSAALAMTIVPTVTAQEDGSTPLDPAARFKAARIEFMAAAQALYPEIDHWTDNAVDSGVVMLGVRSPKPVEFTGYGVYELNMGKSFPVVALAASESGTGCYWQLYWRDLDGKDRFSGKVRFIKTADLVIQRKIRTLA